MIQAESPPGHHLFQVPIAEGIAQIPTKAQDNDLVLKVSPAKQGRPLVLHSFTLSETRLRQIRLGGGNSHQYQGFRTMRERRTCAWRMKRKMRTSLEGTLAGTVR